MLDAPLFQKRIPGFCADAQYLAHLVDVQHIRVIPEHHTVRILSLIHILKILQPLGGVGQQAQLTQGDVAGGQGHQIAHQGLSLIHI